MTRLRPFFVRYALFTAGLILLTLGFIRYAPATYIPKGLVFYPLFFFLMGSLSRYFLHLSLKKSAARFSSTYMILSVGRMLFYLLLIVITAIWISPGSTTYIIAFLAFYILYTVYEISDLYRTLHK